MSFMEGRLGEAAGCRRRRAAKDRGGSRLPGGEGRSGGRQQAPWHQAARPTIRDPATKARAQSALKKAKRGFTTALERIDPKILADVVVKATSLQDGPTPASRRRGSAYRIGEIAIGASIPPCIQFSIERVDDPDEVLQGVERALAARARLEDWPATNGAGGDRDPRRDGDRRRDPRGGAAGPRARQLGRPPRRHSHRGGNDRAMRAGAAASGLEAASGWRRREPGYR